MKKVLMLMPAFALAFALAASADARGGRSNDDLGVSNYNTAHIHQDVDADSDSGDNRASRGDITTGRADALANGSIDVNRNSASVRAACMCYDDITVRNTNRMYVNQDVDADADSGDNSTGSRYSKYSRYSHRGESDITTGDAISSAYGSIVGNVNVARVSSGSRR